MADDITKTQHIKNVVAMLSDYVKVAETDVKTFGEVMTPISLVNEMLDKLGEDVWMNPNLKWLDPCSGVGIFPVVIIERLMFGLQEVITDEELRYKHIVENMIYMGELQPRNSFVCTHAFDLRNEYALNVYTGSFLSEEFDFHMKEIWGVDKFDIIVQNPPYNKMVDLTFLQKSYSISDKVLFVHPSTWLLDEKGKQKKYTSTKEMIKEHLDSIEFFNGNGVFGISLFVPCVITYLNKHKTSKGIHCIDRINGVEITYDNINSINKFSNTDVYFDLKRKIGNIVSQTGSVWGNKGKKDGDYFVNIAKIKGDVKFRNRVGIKMNVNMISDNFYVMVNKDTEVSKNSKQQPFAFATELEANNFLNYIKTDFARFCLSILKNNGNLRNGELALIPWLDFAQEWSDEKLYKQFGLTQVEINFIEKIIPKYYGNEKIG